MTVEHEDILIGRVIAREAGADDWRGLDDVATRDPDVWHRLALAQRDHDALAADVASATDVAERVDIPVHAAAATHQVTVRLRAWAGWAAAAALAVAWLGSMGLLGQTPRQSASNSAATVFPASLSPEEALDHYIMEGRQHGRVVGELPKVMVDSRPGPNGDTLEVIFLRRIVERATVDSVLTVDEDDAGMPRLTPAAGRFTFTSDPM